MKSTLVFAMVLVVCNAYADDDMIQAKCLGMSTALELPDTRVFKGFVYFGKEAKEIKDKYGINSDEYVAWLIKNAEAVGWGKGRTDGLLYADGKEFAMDIFMGYCWRDDLALRTEMLTKLDFLNKH